PAYQVDGVRVDLVYLFGNVSFRGQRQRFRCESRIFWRIGQHAGKSCGEADWKFSSPSRARAVQRAQQQVQREALSSLPAIESIRIVCHQVREFGGGEIETQIYRRRKSSQQGRYRSLRDIHELKLFFRLRKRQHARTAMALCLTRQLQWYFAAIRRNQAQRNRYMQWFLVRLSGGRRAGLLNGQCVAAPNGVVAGCDFQKRRTSLLVPTLELRKINAGRVLHGLHKFLGADSLAVMAFKVEIHTFAETKRSNQRMDHAYNFGPLLVHRGSVEIADLHVRLRTHRVRHWSGILGELRTAQRPDFLDALQRARI